MNRNVAACLIGITCMTSSVRPDGPFRRIAYRLDEPGRVSSAVYDAEGRQVRTLLCGRPQAAGTHAVGWDGLDRDGRPVAPGTYTWKLLRVPGFRAAYVTSLGINPGSAPHDRWVGNHGGAASVAVDGTGMYIAAQITETAPVLLKQSLDGTKRLWTRGRGDVTKGRYQGGISLAADGRGRLYMLQQNGYLQVIDAAKGTLAATWDVLPADLKRKADGGPTYFIYHHGDEVAGADMDARGETVVVGYRDRDRVRWVSPRDGSTAGETAVPAPAGLAVGPGGRVFVISGNRVLAINRDGTSTPVIEEDLAAPRRIAVDPDTGAFLVAEGPPDRRVKRFAPDGTLLAAFGRAGGRREGAYRPADFRGITDITADGKGGFVAVEHRPAPRRVVHCDKAGAVTGEWYGGQPYYAWAEPDPRNPALAWFNAGDWLTLAEIDYAAGRWRVRETWRIGGMADGLVESRPGHHGRWWVVYRDGRRYLVSYGPPQVLRHDEGTLRAVTVIGDEKDVARAAAIAGRGKKAKSFRWLDENGDGRPQKGEFTFSDRREIPAARWVAPDFAVLQQGTAEDGGAIVFTVLETRPAWRDGLPVYPIGDAPGLQRRAAGIPVTARQGSRGSGAFKDAAGNYYGNFNDGRERHGTTWPTHWGGVSRLVKWDPDGRVRWSVGRHAIHGGLGGAPGSTPPGRFHVPVNVIGETDAAVILADRVENTAMAWTRDGLYAGSFFDRRADDGLPERVYHWWRAPDGTDAITTSDNAEGGRVMQRKDGTVLWFAQGRNSVPVYRVDGWDDWTRLAGTVDVTGTPPHAARKGTGLRAAYYAGPAIGATPALQRVDTQVWAGSPRKKPGNDAVVDGFGHGPVYDWSPGIAGLETGGGFAVRRRGLVEAPLTEPFVFSTYARGGVRLWIDGGQRIFGWNQATERWETDPIPLRAGRRYALQLDFYTTHKHPACSLNWESPSLDRRRIPAAFLYPEPVPAAKPDARPATTRIDARTFDGQSGQIGPKDVRDAVRGLRQRALGVTGAWLVYRRIDFGDGASRLRVAATGSPAGRGEFPVTLAFRLDKPGGPAIATVALAEDGPAEESVAPAEPVTGVHDLYVVNTTVKKWHFITFSGFRFLKDE